ncbi:hypothetical protein [Halobacteriovorax sp.]|uniref:hypothetical protein n=1 Tax=Halobacteriovorax sp. TaxID=2020862 RepID=UPI0035663244
MANSESSGIIMYTTEAPKGAMVKRNNFITLETIDILVDKGDTLATRKFFDQFQITYYISPVSESINISPTDPKISFERNIPLEVSFKLNNDIAYNSIHIIYHSQVNKNESEIGILSKSSYQITNNTLTFKTDHFGSYQLVHLQPILTKNLIKRSKDTILKRKIKKYEIVPVNW